MTNSPNRMLDEFAKLMTDFAGTAQTMGREAQNAMRAQFERFLQDMDVVQREEFDAMRDMLVRTRTENDALAARVEALEAALGAAPKAAKPAKSTGQKRPAKDK